MGSSRFIIRGSSMEPDFFDGEEIAVQKSDNYSRGDVIVFTAGRYGTLIKRITGMPGDKIPQIAHLKNWSDIYGYLHEDWFIVEGNLNSVDSKIFGPIHRDYILGKAVKING
jgi:signal peptidase I